MSATRVALYLSTALGMVCTVPAQAQDAVLEMTDQISVTASLQPVKVSETGASVTVLTQDDLQATGSTPLIETLAQTTGLSYSRNGGLGGQATLRIRGLGSDYIGTRLDGIDITDPSSTQTAFDFGGLTGSGLSRVEVLRGSQSALYGANAIAGVVDITSWRPTEDGQSGEVSAEGGSNGTWSGTLATGVKGERGELAFSAGRTITSGVSTAKAGTEDDGFQTSNASLYGKYVVTPEFSIGANGFWRDGHLNYDDEYDADYVLKDSAATQDSTLRGGRLFSDFTIGDVSNEIAVSRSQTVRDITSPSWGYSNYEGTRTSYDYTGNWALNDKVSFNWGATHAKETFSDASAWSSDLGSSWTNAVYGEALLKPRSDLDVSVALRNDVHELFGGKTTGRIAAAWTPVELWTIRGVASTGYRAPSLYELHSSYYGNPDLTPETSKSYELGAERQFDRGSVQATLFKTSIHDRILWSYTTYLYEQVSGNTTSQGIELTGHYDVTPDLKITGNYTYTDAMQDSTSGGRTRAVQVPRHTFNIGVERTFADVWHAGASLTRVADVVDSDGALPDYTLVGISVAYDVTDKVQAFARIENLFDEDYETVRDYGQPGRQAFLGLRARF